MASALRGKPISRRPGAPAERPPPYHRRRDAAALRLVRQRGVLAPAVADAHGPAVHQSHRAAQAWCVAGRGGRAAQRREHAPRAGEAGDVSAGGFHDDAAELPECNGRERRDADQPEAASRRGRVPAAHRVRQRGQPAAGAGHGTRARDGGPDVDWRRPPAAAASAPDRECAALSGGRRARCAVRVRRDSFDRRR